MCFKARCWWIQEKKQQAKMCQWCLPQMTSKETWTKNRVWWCFLKIGSFHFSHPHPYKLRNRKFNTEVLNSNTLDTGSIFPSPYRTTVGHHLSPHLWRVDASAGAGEHTSALCLLTLSQHQTDQSQSLSDFQLCTSTADCSFPKNGVTKLSDNLLPTHPTTTNVQNCKISYCW